MCADLYDRNFPLAQLRFLPDPNRVIDNSLILLPNLAFSRMRMMLMLIHSLDYIHDSKYYWPCKTRARTLPGTQRDRQHSQKAKKAS